ncbi:MAG: cobyrinate a,c-diamide synthase [Symbiobacteriia bacterium]
MPTAIATPRLVVAAAQSGAGKTTVATGLMAAFTSRGLRVQPYKVGPDYIDPTYHTAATGRPSRNLDSWMFGEDALRALAARSMRDADLALIEGVMGLYDGSGATSEAGSTAQVARCLAAPVLLVLDARGMARTAVALIQGLQAFDPALRLAGVVFNNVGSESHYQLLCEVVRTYVDGVEPVGYLPKQASIHMPERHLGLVPSYEQSQVAAYLSSLADLVSRTIDLDAVLRLARSSGPLPEPEVPQAPVAQSRTEPGAVPEPGAIPEPTAILEPAAVPEPARPVRIGLARDEAFHFYYEDGLDVLRSLGAELVAFSPLRDGALLPDLDALYLGGGFPEVYRRELADNASLRLAVGRAIAADMPVYAECGGLMFLAEAIVDGDGLEWPMVGAIPVKARMQQRLASLGYVTAVAQGETLLARPGETLTGHEFHWSVLDQRPPGWEPAYLATTRRGGTRPEGFRRRRLLASYVHVHFAAQPAAAARFVAAARAYQEERQEGARS